MNINIIATGTITNVIIVIAFMMASQTFLHSHARNINESPKSLLPQKMDLMQPSGWDVNCRGVGARGKATPTRQGTKQQEARASNEACMAARGRRRQPDRDSEQDEEGVKDEEGAARRLTGRCTSGREEGVKDEEGAKDTLIFIQAGVS